MAAVLQARGMVVKWGDPARQQPVEYRFPQTVWPSTALPGRIGEHIPEKLAEGEIKSRDSESDSGYTTASPVGNDAPAGPQTPDKESRQDQSTDSAGVESPPADPLRSLKWTRLQTRQQRVITAASDTRAREVIVRNQAKPAWRQLTPRPPTPPPPPSRDPNDPWGTGSVARGQVGAGLELARGSVASNSWPDSSSPRTRPHALHSTTEAAGGLPSSGQHDDAPELPWSPVSAKTHQVVRILQRPQSRDPQNPWVNSPTSRNSTSGLSSGSSNPHIAEPPRRLPDFSNTDMRGVQARIDVKSSPPAASLGVAPPSNGRSLDELMLFRSDQSDLWADPPLLPRAPAEIVGTLPHPCHNR